MNGEIGLIIELQTAARKTALTPHPFRRVKSLCSSVRRFRDATIKEKCKGDYPQALQAMLKALDRAEDLIQN